MLSLLEDFHRFSGLRINPNKCVLLKIGPHADTNAAYYTLKKLYWSPKLVKILGIEISTDAHTLLTENYSSVMTQVDNIINSWHNRNLTLQVGSG